MTKADASHDRLHELVRVLLDDEIGETDRRELADLLRDDPAAVEHYLALMALDAELTWECGRGPLPFEEHAKPASRSADTARAGLRRQSRAAWMGWGAAALAAVVVLAVIALRQDDETGPVAASALTLDYVAGEILVVDDGRALRPEVGMRLSPNIDITARGPRSLARLAYDDGSLVLLSGQTSAAFSGVGQKTLEVQRGAVAATVVPQPAGRPMLVTTPQARLEVLGTEFSLAASAEFTDVQVTQGSVKLTRVADGRSVVVPEGKRAATDGARSELAVRDAAAPPETWEEDFERGRPASWLSGTFVAAGLPPGSRGALQAALDEETQVYALASPHPWIDGLFVARADTHLHVRFKMARPDWINVFFITRPPNPGEPATSLYKFNGLPSSPSDASRWRTAAIPLRAFQKKTPRGFEEAPAPTGEVVFGISLSAPAPDRGLVIDRLWITRGGPGKLVVQDADQMGDAP